MLIFSAVQICAFESKKSLFFSFLIAFFFADPDPGSQNLADPMNLDLNCTGIQAKLGS